LKIKTSSFLVEPTKMSLTTYSRDYLQAIPQQRKEQAVDSIVQTILSEIHAAAAVGGTSYRYVRPPKDGRVPAHRHPELVLTDADIIAGFFARFPGCKIYYEEAWVDSGRDTKTLKKGIVIDWS
jgi:hypothetical protein